MASPRDGASVETLREAARLYVDATSLRHAAREIGMSPTGLRGFIDGADPYVKTTRKLTEWYVREIQNRNAELTSESAGAALSLLLKHYPPAHRASVAQEVLEVLDNRCRETQTPRPAWLVDMREGAEG
jgi:predicted phosphohydrolase